MSQKIIQRDGYLEIKCKPCGHHLVSTYQEAEHRWTFNQNYESPTLTPSVKVNCNDPTHPSYNAHAKSSVCHFFVTDGKIIYCADCTHDLAGQTVELEEYSDAEVKARGVQ